MKLFKRENLGLCCKACVVFMILGLLSVPTIYGGGSLVEDGCIHCSLPLTPCSEEQMDACRSTNNQIFNPDGPPMFLDNWSCTGACYKSDDGGLVAICIAWPFYSSCSYDGDPACEDNVQKRDCGKMIMFNPGGEPAGYKCTNYCTGVWDPVDGSIVNCT